MLSQGVPMLLFGDEVLRTQRGNNNGYCQNNELCWLDWNLAERNRDMLAFTRAMIAFRHRHQTLSRERFLTGQPEQGHTLPDIHWHGLELDRPGWDDEDTRVLAFTLAGADVEEPPLHVMLNLGERPEAFVLPELPDIRWRLAVDTGREPWVFDPRDHAVAVDGRYDMFERSVAVLEGRRS
jgi:glycogen operon protein